MKLTDLPAEVIVAIFDCLEDNMDKVALRETCRAMGVTIRWEPSFPKKTLSAYIDRGELYLTWLWNRGCTWDPWTCTLAARRGDLEVLEWLRARQVPWGWGPCEAAAENGHLDVLRWLTSRGCSLEARTCNAAARGGQIEVLEWLRGKGCPVNDTIYTHAAGRGHVKVLAWLRHEGYPVRREWLNIIVEMCSRQEVIEWLKNQ